MGNTNDKSYDGGQKEDCEKCFDELESKNINSKKDFRKWSLKNHPDKGGDVEIFQIISSCNDDFYGSNVKCNKDEIKTNKQAKPTQKYKEEQERKYHDERRKEKERKQAEEKLRQEEIKKRNDEEKRRKQEEEYIRRNKTKKEEENEDMKWFENEETYRKRKEKERFKKEEEERWSNAYDAYNAYNTYGNMYRDTYKKEKRENLDENFGHGIYENQRWEGKPDWEWEWLTEAELKAEEEKISNARKQYIKNIITKKSYEYADKLINKNISVRPIPDYVYIKAREISKNIMLNIAKKVIGNNINYLRFMSGYFKYRDTVVNYELILNSIEREINKHLDKIYQAFKTEFK